jgi:hypothetical protein
MPAKSTLNTAAREQVLFDVIVVDDKSIISLFRICVI